MTQGAVSCIAFHPSDPDLVIGGARAAAPDCSTLLLKKIYRLEHAPTGMMRTTRRARPS